MKEIFLNSSFTLVVTVAMSQLCFAAEQDSDPANSISCLSSIAVSNPDKFLGYIFEKGIDRKAAIGFHGTSLESIKKARLEGRLQTGAVKGNEGKWYIFPNLLHPKIQQLINEKKLVVQDGIIGNDYSGDYSSPGALKHAWDETVVYSKRIAQEHRLLTELDLEINIENADAAANVVSMPDGSKSYAYFERKGFTKKQIIAAFKKSQQAKGIVLAIGSNVLGNLLLENATIGDHGLSLAAPNGVKLQFIIGLEPLDNESFKFFEGLQSK